MESGTPRTWLLLISKLRSSAFWHRVVFWQEVHAASILMAIHSEDGGRTMDVWNIDIFPQHYTLSQARRNGIFTAVETSKLNPAPNFFLNIILNCFCHFQIRNSNRSSRILITLTSPMKHPQVHHQPYIYWSSKRKITSVYHRQYYVKGTQILLLYVNNSSSAIHVNSPHVAMTNISKKCTQHIRHSQ